MENIPVIIHPSWIPHLSPLFKLPSMRLLKEEILIHGTFYPHPDNIFRVFKMPLHEIKVVILGQDPYPQRGQANGLAFSVNRGVKVTKTLNIIRKEIYDECVRGDLTQEDLLLGPKDPEGWSTLLHWVDQGVFLTNTALTVGRGESNSHREYWEDFMKGVIHVIATEVKPIWLLWGANARSMGWEIFQHHEEGRIRGSIENRTMSAAHPVNESRKPGQGGFYGCNHFKKVNDLLRENNKQTINW